MMSTPTAITRRPRPPSTRARSKLSSSTVLDDLPSMPGAFDRSPASSSSSKVPLSSSMSASSLPSSSSNTSVMDTPLSAYPRHRKHVNRSALPRISASPDIGNISAGLDVDASYFLDRSDNSKRRPMVARASSLRSSVGSEAEPSPPPPYGRELPGSNTSSAEKHQQQMQESVVHEQGTERLRARRAAEAARSLGLDIDFGPNATEPVTPSSEVDISELEMRAKYREARRQLQQRELELQMAAQVAEQMLRRHEEFVARLPPQLSSSTPGMDELLAMHRQQEAMSRSSSFRGSPGAMSQSASSQGFPQMQRQMNSSRISTTPTRPPIGGTSSFSRSQSSLVSRAGMSDSPFMAARAEYAALQRQEHDERVSALENALAEAKEGEEAQRKLAARIRKDFEKLQREYDRTEAMMERAQDKQPLNIGTPRERTFSEPQPRSLWRRRDATVDKDLRSSYARARDPEEDEVERHVDQVNRASFSTDHVDAAGDSSRRSRISEGMDDLGEVVERLSRMTVASLRASREASAAAAAAESISDTNTAPDQDEDPSSPSSVNAATVHQAQSVTKQEARHLTLPANALDTRRIRKKISQSTFLEPTPKRDSAIRPLLEPSSPLAPRVTIQAPNSPGGSSVGHSSEVSRAASGVRRRTPSPYPSPQASLASTPASSGFFDPTPSPIPHHTLSGLTARMANMRSQAMSLSPTPSRINGRTLGSELGSVMADGYFNESISRSISNVSQGDLGSEMSYDDGSMVDMPQPLPSKISAALSGLAMALGSTPIAGQPDGDIDRRIGELLNEAVRLRSIRWADEDASSMAPSPSSARHAGMPSAKSDLQALVETWRAPRGDADDVEDDEVDRLDLTLDAPTVGVDSTFEGDFTGTAASPSILRATPQPIRPTIALAHRRTDSLQTIQTLRYALSHSQYRQQMQQHAINELRRHRSRSIEALSLEVQSLQYETQSIRTSMTTMSSTTLLLEPVTVPGRIVNDFICLSLLVLDWIEIVLVLVYRVTMDLKHGERRTLGEKLRGSRKRYYL